LAQVFWLVQLAAFQLETKHLGNVQVL